MVNILDITVSFNIFTVLIATLFFTVFTMGLAWLNRGIRMSLIQNPRKLTYVVITTFVAWFMISVILFTIIPSMYVVFDEIRKMFV